MNEHRAMFLCEEEGGLEQLPGIRHGQGHPKYRRCRRSSRGKGTRCLTGGTPRRTIRAAEGFAHEPSKRPRNAWRRSARRSCAARRATNRCGRWAGVGPTRHDSGRVRRRALRNQGRAPRGCMTNETKRCGWRHATNETQRRSPCLSSRSRKSACKRSAVWPRSASAQGRRHGCPRFLKGRPCRCCRKGTRRTRLALRRPEAMRRARRTPPASSQSHAACDP